MSATNGRVQEFEIVAAGSSYFPGTAQSDVACDSKATDGVLFTWNGVTENGMDATSFAASGFVRSQVMIAETTAYSVIGIRKKTV